MLGWREWVGLPRLGLPAVRCKVDTGARSSALHVDSCWRFIERGAPWVGFRLSNDGHGEAMLQTAAPIYDERDVIDSGGHRTRRIFLRTTLALAGIEREIEINLTDRQGMLFPMLLGRTAMAGMFAVDPGRSFLQGRPGIGMTSLRLCKSVRDSGLARHPGEEPILCGECLFESPIPNSESRPS